MPRALVATLLTFLALPVLASPQNTVEHSVNRWPARALGIAAFDEGPYFRNPVVCAPALVGIVLFAIPGEVVYGFAMTFLIPTYVLVPHTDLQYRLARDLAALTRVIGGLALGTPFLPISYFADEDRCSPAIGTFMIPPEGTVLHPPDRDPDNEEPRPAGRVPRPVRGHKRR